MLRTNQNRRRAIGLVELMVAMALSIGIMWILAESFKMGLDMTRNAHSTGTMMSQLDGARAVMARDILAEHFLPDDNKPNRGVHLSDQRLDWLNNGGQGWYPPTGGFFRIISPVQTLVNADSNGYAMNTAANHALHFTSILPAKDQNLYTVNVNGGSYYSRAAEVAYFLVDSGIRTSPDPINGKPLYHLIRRQKLVAMTNDELPSLVGGLADPSVIAGVGAPTNKVYTLADVCDPTKRLAISPSTVPSTITGAVSAGIMFGIATPRYGEDLLLSNVLSFEVLADWSPSQVTGSTAAARLPTAPNWDWPFDTLAVNAGKNPAYSNQGVFDTWYPVANWNNFGLGSNTVALPLAVRVKQLQITVRVFDPKTKQARQSTWKFGM